MSTVVRASKVRHVYGTAAKPEFNYQNIRLAAGAAGDGNLIKANPLYFGVPVTSGGGSLAIVNLSNPGRLPAQPPVIDGHKGPVVDFEFNPFHTGLVATGGDDATVKIWGIPTGGLTENMTDPLVNLPGHQRKVTCVRYHPVAEHLLATTGADKTVKVWDIENEDCVTDMASSDIPLDLIFSWTGDLIIGTFKDKTIKMFDPRSGEIANEVTSADTPKSQKLCWLGDMGRFISTCFTRQSKRRYKIWDPRNMADPIKTVEIDQSAGVLMPFFDNGTRVLYFGSKGASHIKYSEMVPDAPYEHHIAQYAHKSPTKGLALMPTRAQDVMKCEVAKFLNLTNDSVDVVSMTIPRKSDLFQEDIFPDAYAGIAALHAEEFLAGESASPVMMSLNPNPDAGDAKKKKTTRVTQRKTAAVLQRELDAANARIKKLEDALKKAGVAVPN